MSDSKRVESHGCDDHPIIRPDEGGSVASEEFTTRFRSELEPND